MRKLVWSVLAMAGLMQSTGCIIGSTDSQGAFFADWDVTIDGVSVNMCSEAGVGWVEIQSVRAGSSLIIRDPFPCDNFQGTTFDLDEGTYTVTVSALDTNPDPAAAQVVASFTPFTATIVGGSVTDITGGVPFVFDFIANFAVTFSVDYLTVGNNCDETGAGVAQQNVLLMDTGASTCIPVAITGTDDPAAETCSPALCQEVSAIQTLALPQGTYDIIVEGLKGAAGSQPVICYESSLLTFMVTGDGDIGIIDAPFNDAPGVCQLKPARAPR